MDSQKTDETKADGGDASGELSEAVNNIPRVNSDSEQGITTPESKDINQNKTDEKKEDNVQLDDDLLSKLVQDTIIESPEASQAVPTMNNNNKRKLPNTPAKSQPSKARRTDTKAQKDEGKPRIRSAPSVFLQRSSRAPPAPRPVPRKNLADQYNNCMHGDPGDYLCVDCFYNRWRSEWDFLQPIQSK